MDNVLPVSDAESFRRWLEANHGSQRECWLELRRGRPSDPDGFYYLDAVEVALCFGWIDSTQKIADDGRRLQRFSPRTPKGPWSELNKERVRRLERLGLMTDAGRKVLPPMSPRSFRIDPDIETALKNARVWSRFRSFPPLYQRVKAYNIAFFEKREPKTYKRMLAHLIEETKKGRMYGEWNDYGRLLEE